MNIEEVIQTKERIQRELNIALASMEKKDTIKQLRNEMKQNQARCPHYSPIFQWTWANNVCPYCGKKVEEQK